jgi:hypothetical protein
MARTASLSDGASRARTGDLLGAIRGQVGRPGDERGRLSGFWRMQRARNSRLSPALLTNFSPIGSARSA